MTGGYNVLLGNPSKLCLLVYWYSDNWTNNATWCTSKSCNAGFQFLIFDIYFAHTICSNLSGVWLVFSKQILFGPLPITEGKSLGSALLLHISNILEKLCYKSGAFYSWLWFCRNQSLVTGFGKNSISLAYFQTQGQEVGGQCIVAWRWHIREACSWIFYLLIMLLHNLVSSHLF